MTDDVQSGTAAAPGETDQETQLEGGDPSSGQSTERAPLSKHLQEVLLGLVRMQTRRDMAARRVQVLDARTQRFFYRGLQYLAYSAKDETLVSLNGLSLGKGTEDNDSVRQTFNIYLGYAKSFMAVFSQGLPKCTPDPVEPKKPLDITAAAEALKAKRVIEAANNPKTIQIKVARFLWTDGLAVAYTRSVEKKGQPTEMIDVDGALEWRLPMSCSVLADCGFAQRNKEFDIAFLKAKFPDVADSITANGNDDFDRMSRIAVAQGMNKEANNQGGGAGYMATFSQTWLRPWTFEELEDKADKAALKERFTKGCYVAFAGDTYCEDADESMDGCIKLLHALEGDGIHRPSVGKSMMSAQEAFNGMMNLAQETFEYGVPSTWVDQEAVDVDAIQEQESKPKMYLPFDRTANESAESHFFQEAAAEPSAAMMAYMQDLQGPLCQFLTGQQPSLYGAEMEDQKTASGFAMARNQAMGILGLQWMPYTLWYSMVIADAVNCMADCRSGIVAALVPSRRAGKKDMVSVDVAALREGKHSWSPDPDDNVPQSWTERSNAFKQFSAEVSKTPEGMKVLSLPDNLALGKQMWGLQDLTLPEEDSRDKQLEEIDELLEATPIPDEEAFNAAMQQWQQQDQASQANVQPGQPPPAPVPAPNQTDFQKSSVPIDVEYDDHGAEYDEVVTFVNSKDGRRMKLAKPLGFENVRLHGLEHKKAMQAAQAPPQGKPASMSINFKDVPPAAQLQMLSQEGIRVGAQDLAGNSAA
jgi:hypothetical protein